MLQNMGLCSSIGISLVTMTVAMAMVPDWDNGKGICANHIYKGRTFIQVPHRFSM